MPVKINPGGLNPQSGKTQATKSGKSDPAQFTSNLKNARTAMFDGDMKELLKVVKDRGESFLRSPDENLLTSYKESVKMFLTKLKKEFLSLREEFGARQDGEQKVYQLVETVSSEAEALTRQALNENKALELLSGLDDIRGLVIDIIG